ncbi:MAG: stalk domain-containing protein [Clostridia bacterium]
MKRLLSLLIVFSMLLLMLPVRAANETFIAINNIVLPLTSSMPVRTGGTWYMDYQSFTQGDLGINVSCNADIGTATLYSWDKTIVFNINKGTAYDVKSSISHKQWAYYRGGTIYVPVSFVCEQFGITFTYLNSVSLLRLKTNSSITDSMFVYIAKKRIPDLLAQYYGSQTPAHKPPSKPSSGNNGATGGNHTVPPPRPSPSQPPTPDVPGVTAPTAPPSVPAAKTAYLTIDLVSGANNDEILALLNEYNMACTFFVGADAIAANDDSFRRVAATNHALGVYGKTLADLERANKLMYNTAFRKSRLAHVTTDFAAVTDSGYRAWGCHADARTQTSGEVIATLGARAITVVRLDDSASGVKKLRKILPYLAESGFVVRPLSIMDAPVVP